MSLRAVTNRPGRRAAPALRCGGGQDNPLWRPACSGRVPCSTKMRYPMGAPGGGSRGGLVPAESAGPAAGDWLSGRAPRSHRGGHWFDPSIAHRCKTRSETPLTVLILLDGWELSPYWEESGRSCSPRTSCRTASTPTVTAGQLHKTENVCREADRDRI